MTTPWPEVNELLSQRILDATEADPELTALDQRHIDAWADSHEGYTVQTRVAVVSCIWCDYVAVAPTKREALAKYQRQHEQPMLDRERERMAARRAVRNG